jgi:hypothetical protein
MNVNAILDLPIWRQAGGLHRTLRAIRDGALTIGFTGGSITDPRAGWNWPEAVTAWFVEKFPGVRISVENAAIGATGSELAVFRAQRDLIDRGCHLVFVEYAVNDQGEPAEKRMRTREGLLRKLLAGEGRDVVLAYTYMQDFYADVIAGRMPASVADFEMLGRHYGIGSVRMGLHAFREVMQGRMRWEEWLPDGLHPQSRGSLSYAQSVIGYLERELISAPGAAAIPTGADRPSPLNEQNWEAAYGLPFAQVTLTGPWTVQRWSKLVWIDQVLATAAVGAGLSFDFTGRGLSLGFDFGKTSAEFRYRLDGGPWEASKRDRPAWCPDEGWYRISNIADDLEAGAHHFDLEVVHGNTEGCTGTNFRLALIGVVP